jgi:hypothetical protein
VYPKNLSPGFEKDRTFDESVDDVAISDVGILDMVDEFYSVQSGHAPRFGAGTRTHARSLVIGYGTLKYKKILARWQGMIDDAVKKVISTLTVAGGAYYDALGAEDHFGVVARFPGFETSRAHMFWILESLQGRYLDPGSAGALAATAALNKLGQAVAPHHPADGAVGCRPMSAKDLIHRVMEVFDQDLSSAKTILQQVAAVPHTSGPNVVALISRAMDAGVPDRAQASRMLTRSRASFNAMSAIVRSIGSMVRLCHSIASLKEGAPVPILGLVHYIETGQPLLRPPIQGAGFAALSSEHKKLCAAVVHKAVVTMSDLVAQTSQVYNHGMHTLFIDAALTNPVSPGSTVYHVFMGHRTMDVCRVLAEVVQGTNVTLVPLVSTVLPKWAASSVVRKHPVTARGVDTSPPRTTMGTRGDHKFATTCLKYLMGNTGIGSNTPSESSPDLTMAIIEQYRQLVTGVACKKEEDQVAWRQEAAVMALLMETDRTLRRNGLLERYRLGESTPEPPPKKRKREEDPPQETAQPDGMCVVCFGPLHVPFKGGCPAHPVCVLCTVQAVHTMVHGQFEDAAFGAGKDPLTCPAEHCMFRRSFEDQTGVLGYVPLSTQVVMAFNKTRAANRCIPAGARACPVCATVQHGGALDDTVHTCQACGCITCPGCLGAAHYGVVCPRTLATTCQAMGTLGVAELLSETKIVKCPTCSAPFKKEQGCNHMTCTNVVATGGAGAPPSPCNTNFCYLCGIKIQGSTDIVDHYERCIAMHRQYDLDVETYRMVGILQKCKRTKVSPLSQTPVTLDVIEAAISSLTGGGCAAFAQTEADL